MNQEKTIYVDKIGKIILKKSRKFRRLLIKMAPGKGIWVNIPAPLNFKDGERLIKEQQDWIHKNIAKINLKQNNQTLFTPETSFKTRYHKLQMIKESRSSMSANLSNGILKVYYPPEIDVKSEQVQNFTRKVVIETLRREALYHIPRRIMELANQHNFSYKTVKMRNATTVWGSCSYENNINLNIHLMRLPQHLIDYVILHELCHTIEKNHSSHFWDLVKTVCPKVNIYKKELRNYSPAVF